MEDHQAVRKVIKAGGSMKLMHLPRTHRVDVAAMSEQFTRGVASSQCERTRNEAADIGTKRFNGSRYFTSSTLSLLSFGKSAEIKIIWHRYSLTDFP
eukprot:6917023-Pyramimonas_sp.AAC.1